MSLNFDKIPIIVIVGPTASGKTKLSVDIALKFSGSIISADSMQIYKELSICTAKPDKFQLKAVKHYLVNEISVKQKFSVAEYVEKARFYAKEIYNHNKTPILVGGTGLYIDSFLKDIKFESNNIPLNFREELYKKFYKNKDSIYMDLIEKDPKSAESIHANDTKRIIRALEFYYYYGYPISEQVIRSKQTFSPYKVKILGLNFRNRQTLYDMINQRVDEMFENGLIDEVRNVSGIIGDTAKGAIGYKEVIPYLQGDCSIDTAIERLKRETRRYAKRQITWFKRYKNINWLYVDDYISFDDLLLNAEKLIEEGEYSEFV